MLITSLHSTKTSQRGVHTQQSSKKITCASVRWVVPRQPCPINTRMQLIQGQWAKHHLLHRQPPVENHPRLLIPVSHRIPWIISLALVHTSKWILRRVKIRHSLLKPVSQLYQNQIRRGVTTITYQRRGSSSKWARAVGAWTSLCWIAPTETSLIANVR